MQASVLAPWQELDRILCAYTYWLDWELRKSWWWSRRIVRSFQRVRVMGARWTSDKPPSSLVEVMGLFSNPSLTERLARLVS